MVTVPGTIPSRSRKSSFRYSPTHPNLGSSSQLCVSARSHRVLIFPFFFHPSLPAWLSVRVSVCALRSISWSGQHSKCRDLSHLRTENLANWGLLKFSPGQSHSIDIYNAIVEPNPNRPWTGTLLQISPRFAVSAIAPVPSEFTMATGMIWACTPSRLYYTLSEVMI